MTGASGRGLLTHVPVSCPSPASSSSSGATMPTRPSPEFSPSTPRDESNSRSSAVRPSRIDTFSRPPDRSGSTRENARFPLLPGGIVGADDEIRTRDPHLGKVVRAVEHGPSRLFRSVSGSNRPPRPPQSAQNVQRSTIAPSRIPLLPRRTDYRCHRCNRRPPIRPGPLSFGP
jgi:hypothetical protein